MNIKLKLLLTGICALTNVCSQSALAASEKRKIVPPIVIYSSCLPRLKEKYNDDVVLVAFEEAEKDTNKFLERLSEVCGGSEHSALWVTNCQNAVDSAKKGNWLEARNQLSLVLGLQRDLPDWLLMKAVADRKTGALEATISDLEYLCQIRKERSIGHKKIWEVQTGRQDDFWFSGKVLESYSNTTRIKANPGSS